jgi:protein phosphatase
MTKSSFGLTETGAIRHENQDGYLMDESNGLFAVADGLGGLPNGARASKIALDLLRKKLADDASTPLEDVLADVNTETRQVGFEMDVAGFGTTLTIGQVQPGSKFIKIAHVGDSAAYLVSNDSVQLLTKEHTVAARMIEEQWQDASEAIPLSAHHTLTQCIGQDLYIEPQVAIFPIQEGDRLFLLTDGVTKPIPESVLQKALQKNAPIAQIAQSLSFKIEAAGAPDNYTILGVEL